MVAAARFLDCLRRKELEGLAGISVSLHGSLAFTGKGHGTDRAVILGLLDERPDEIDPDRVEPLLAAIGESKTLTPTSLPPIAFDPETEERIFLIGNARIPKLAL